MDRYKCPYKFSIDYLIKNEYKLKEDSNNFASQVIKIAIEALEKEMIKNLIEQGDEIAIDLEGRRWAKCILCETINLVDKFITYGEKGYINEGKCRECVKILDESKKLHGYRKLPRTTRPLTDSKEDQELLNDFLISEQDGEPPEQW